MLKRFARWAAKKLLPVIIDIVVDEIRDEVDNNEKKGDE